MIRKLLLVTSLCFFSTAFSQDYLVSWKGDTLYCRLPSNPKKEGLRPAANYTNGYRRITAVTGPDSIKVVEAGQVKSYRRESHGKNLLCDGYFESILVPDGGGRLTNAEGKNEAQWYFMLLEKRGEYASLYKVLSFRKRVNTYYYIVKHDKQNPVPTGYILTNRANTARLMLDDDIATEMEKVLRKEKKYSKLIQEYNRLKAAAANR